MSLQADLERFKRQQEKCQTTLSSINAAKQKQASINNKASTQQKLPSNQQKSAPISNASASASSRSQATSSGKFSDNTEKLQLVNSIRKAPVGAQMKRVIELLEKTRGEFTIEQINEACYVDMNVNKEVFESLTKNAKVKYDGTYFSYKSKYEIRNKDELLLTIQSFLDGISIIDLKDSYLEVMQDLQALKAEGHIWLLSNFDSKEDLAYPNDPRCSMLRVDDDLKQLFRSIELPNDMLEVEKDLRQKGMKPATDTAKRRAAAQIQGLPNKPKQKKKSQDISKRTKLTNYHLPELFKRI